MDNPFNSPFEDVGDKWRLPENAVPHEDTVKVLRSLGGSGEVTNKELTWLAYHLNEDHEARHSWPGEQLFQALVEMFDHRTPAAADRDLIRQDLIAIERECSRVAPPAPGEPALPLSTIRVEEVLLPEVDRTIAVFCDEINDTFDVDLHRQSCSCPVWPKHRSKLRHGDVRRCCNHMVEAYNQLIDAGELTDIIPVLKSVFADRARRGRSIDPASTWKQLKIKMRPYLVMLRHHGWSYVYAPDGADFSRYAYDPEAGRWSFGQAPMNGETVVDWMRGELAGPGGI